MFCCCCWILHYFLLITIHLKLTSGMEGGKLNTSWWIMTIMATDKFISHINYSATAIDNKIKYWHKSYNNGDDQHKTKYHDLHLFSIHLFQYQSLMTQPDISYLVKIQIPCICTINYFCTNIKKPVLHILDILYIVFIVEWGCSTRFE